LAEQVPRYRVIAGLSLRPPRAIYIRSAFYYSGYASALVGFRVETSRYALADTIDMKEPNQDPECAGAS